MIDQGCICQCCGRTFKHDFLLQNEIWKEIRPAEKPEVGGLLCGTCIIQKLETINEFGAWYIEQLP